MYINHPHTVILSTYGICSQQSVSLL